MSRSTIQTHFMVYDPHKHHRRSIRLQDYDYSQPGWYFITICIRDRVCLLGEVFEDRMLRNAFGDIVRACWDDLPAHYSHVVLDAFVVMPNHVHGIIGLTANNDVGAGFKPAPTTMGIKRHALPEIVRAFKTFSARRINALRNHAGTPVWQRNYYEHIIRNGRELERIRKYIHENPTRWHLDSLNLDKH